MVRKYTINQTGPALDTGEVSYMVGEPGLRYIGDRPSLTSAVVMVLTDRRDKPDEPFTLEYNPWKD